MKKPAIPRPSRNADPDQAKFDAAVKEYLEGLRGERGAKLAQLPANASLADVITRLNAILELMQ